MITVVGLGFVGLTTALGFSHKGFNVYGFDIDRSRCDLLKSGRIPFHEPHLGDVLRSSLNDKFFIEDSLEDCLNKSAVVFYCVGTPAKESGEADLTQLLQAIEDTLRYVRENDYKVLVIKSTVPPSTTRDRILPFVESKGFEVGRDIGLACNPEFLREGKSWEDFIEPDRIVIGQYDDRSGQAVKDLYEPFGAPIFRVSLNTGEFIKYLSNTLLATLISFSNEMSMVADSVGDIDIPLSFNIAHMDKRWSGNPANMTSYLYPGCGFGGYCLPKDTQALYAKARALNCSSDLLGSVLNINSEIKKFVVDKVKKVSSKDDYVGILGLSFKPDSDDVREAPPKEVIELLLDEGFNKIVAYDPLATENFRQSYSLPIEYAGSIEEVVRRAKVLLILTAWKEFADRRELYRDRTVLDFRYVLSK